MTARVIVMVYDHGSARVLPWCVPKETLDRIMPKPRTVEDPTPAKLEYVCADCGNEQDSMGRRCDKCGSVRVVLISTIEDIVGPDWRDNFREDGP